VSEIAQQSFPAKNWKSVIDEWTNRFTLPMRFFVVATILYALQQIDESRELDTAARKDCHEKTIFYQYKHHRKLCRQKI